TLTYSTYLGGNITDQGFGVALDGSGNAYVTGLTNSTTAATTVTTIPGTTRGSYDVFVTKLNAAGTAVVWSALFGGSGDDRGFGVAVQAVEIQNVTVTGTSGTFTLTFNGQTTTSLPFNAT